MLTHIHRQAEDNPIIRLSQIVRGGGELKDGAYGESRVIRRAAIDAAQVLAADQVLVGDQPDPARLQSADSRPERLCRSLAGRRRSPRMPAGTTAPRA